MNALVDYGSSDEEDVQSARPAKIARTVATDVAGESQDERIATLEQQDRYPPPSKENSLPLEQPPSSTAPESIPTANAPPPLPSHPSEPAAIGPSIPPPHSNDFNEHETAFTPLEPPLSPYSAERQRIHDLTLPRTANFDIPASPPPPSSTEEEGTRAAALARTTAKFTRFRELKAPVSSSTERKDRGVGRGDDGGGVHFHDRLLRSAALRNPSLFSTLLRFAGASEKESYATVLDGGKGRGVPVEWPEECYVEELLRLNERRRKEKAKGREKVDFVPAGGVDTSGGR